MTARSLIAVLLVIATLIITSLYAAQEDFLGRVALELNDVGDLEPPASGDRILVLAPHPDDEVLGSGGLIQKALAAGADVRVVFLTLGDNNLVSFLTFSKRPVVTPTQVRAMGETRRVEALAALDVLGVSPDHVAFLGYPDASTLQIWESHWSGIGALWSRWVRSRQVPYEEAFSTGASYSGQSVLADLKQIIVEYAPTTIFVSHPDDTNLDHQALWLFGQAALLDLGPPYDTTPLWSYLVHYGTWPRPQENQQGHYLLPPNALLHRDMSWVKLLLDEEQVATKVAALSKHASQLSLRKSYLSSFVRPNELFAQVAPIRLSEPLIEWQGVELGPLIGSPRASVLKRLAPGLFLDAFDLRLEADDVVLSLVTDRPLGTRQTLVLRLFPHSVGSAFAEAPKVEITLENAGLRSAHDLQRDMQSDVLFERDGNRMLIRISRAALGQPDALFLAASMRSNGIRFDQTGWRLVFLEPSSPHGAGQVPQAGALRARLEQDGGDSGSEAVSGQ